ncbi:T9SS type A sorting domain-containing protein [Flavivirga eckloniae]|uniref:Secretion system C-terminal sorting domain-containing protein n=1 Tax=Flavivirga eckloniae TaxID=1803846 RepID=A0A2K9PU58_9FLAO|nr:T9SS type A sorting domain-containing protein [Flavivirga eckloniae]AUP80584.1 hypothetical protein C1H87_18450 [Flavivirga eckloniae]
MMKKLLFLTAFLAAAISFAQDALSWNGNTFDTGTSLTIPITYTSDAVIPGGSITVELWVQQNAAPWGQQWKKAVTHGADLPAGTDLSADIIMDAAGAVANVLNGSNFKTTTEMQASELFGVGEDAGGYRLRISNSDSGFTATLPAQNYITINGTLSADDIGIQKISVSPNPTASTITISTRNNDIKSAKVFDVAGKEVKSFNQLTNMDVSSLARGLYFLRTNTGSVSKFIKN